MYQQAEHITIERGFELYHHRKTGKINAHSPPHQNAHRRVRDRFLEFLDPDMPWNAVRRAHLDAYAFWRREDVGPRQVESELRLFQAVSNWLRVYLELPVRNPVEGFSFRALKREHEPNRPRYSDDEIRRLRAAAESVDPRLRLLVALCDETAARYGILCELRRSDLDGRPKGRRETPDGNWLELPRDKAGHRHLVPLTQSATFELMRARAAYLGPLEMAYRQNDEDYHLIPSRMRGGKALPGTDPLDRRNALRLLRRAEKRAGVPYVRGRGFHGIRRRSIDRIAETGAGPDTLMAAGQWSSTTCPLRIYHNHQSFRSLERVRELREGRDSGKVVPIERARSA